MTQDTQTGAGAQPAPAQQPAFLTLVQECADYATSLRSAALVVKTAHGTAPLSFIRAADLCERAAARIAELDRWREAVRNGSALLNRVEQDPAEAALTRILRIVQNYLPPDSDKSAHEALSDIIAEVDPWPREMAPLRHLERQHAELSTALAEAKHWRNNHDNLAARLRVFTQRPDIPKELADRLPWYRELVRLQAVEAQTAAKCLHQGAEAAAVAALKGLLSLVRREAPQLSGKVLGDAESAIAALQAASPAQPVGRASDDGRVDWFDPIPEGGAFVYAAPTQGPRTPGSFVNAAGIHASDKPATVVRKLDAAFHDAVTFADTPAQAQEDAPIVWPKSRDVGRIGDMSMSASLRVGLDADNDTYVNVWDEKGGGSIEFCTPGAGGGKSRRTRVALLALMVAMEADNAEDPRRDWWAARAAQGGPL